MPTHAPSYLETVREQGLDIRQLLAMASTSCGARQAGYSTFFDGGVYGCITSRFLTSIVFPLLQHRASVDSGPTLSLLPETGAGSAEHHSRCPSGPSQLCSSRVVDFFHLQCAGLIPSHSDTRKRVLVAGTGFVGSHLVNRLMLPGHGILDNSTPLLSKGQAMGPPPIPSSPTSSVAPSPAQHTRRRRRHHSRSPRRRRTRKTKDAPLGTISERLKIDVAVSTTDVDGHSLSSTGGKVQRAQINMLTNMNYLYRIFPPSPSISPPSKTRMAGLMTSRQSNDSTVIEAGILLSEEPASNVSAFCYASFLTLTGSRVDWPPKNDNSRQPTRFPPVKLLSPSNRMCISVDTLTRSALALVTTKASVSLRPLLTDALVSRFSSLLIKDLANNLFRHVDVSNETPGTQHALFTGLGYWKGFLTICCSLRQHLHSGHRRFVFNVLEFGNDALSHRRFHPAFEELRFQSLVTLSQTDSVVKFWTLDLSAVDLEGSPS
ncbi:hypothetical protein BDZ89DRAFT_1142306 [Hymenopellis radicata]|nr:hypothetical protein BDZ89DRAFT_1142306 [Hymenopellis radicata]